MKSSIITAILAFASIAAAQPHRHHRHQQYHRLDKRDEVIVIEEVIIGVLPGANGAAVTTLTKLITSTSTSPPQTTTTTVPVQAVGAAAVAPSDPSPPPPAATPTPTPTPQAQVQAAELQPSSAAPAAPSGSPPAVVPPPENAPGLFGITYGPYDDAGNPKDQGTITSDIAKMKGYSVVRIFDANDRTPMVISAAKAAGMKVYAGVNNGALSSGGLNDGLNYIAQGAKTAGWDTIYAIGIGNEWVFQGNSADQLMGFIATAKSTLGGQGYSGPVVAPDTSAAYTANKALCGGDFASISAHAFFQQGGCPVNQAAKSVKAQYDNVVAACPGKKVYISETGWPSAGGPGATSEASPAAQKTVIDDIKALFPDGNVMFISAFNEPWKLKYGADPMGIEAHWGMLGQ